MTFMSHAIRLLEDTIRFFFRCALLIVVLCIYVVAVITAFGFFTGIIQ